MSTMRPCALSSSAVTRSRDSVWAAAALPEITWARLGGGYVRRVPMASCILIIRAALALAAARHRVKFKPMPDQIVAELFGDEMLQLFYVIIAKLDDTPALQVDEVVVMRARHLLIA